MYKAKRQPFSDPFQDLSKRSLLKFEKGNNISVFWTRLTLSKGPQWDKVAAPTKFLYAIEDLGYGAHGRVWLTCASCGAVCVLKFALDGKGSLLDSEKKVWEKFTLLKSKSFGKTGVVSLPFACHILRKSNSPTESMLYLW